MRIKTLACVAAAAFAVPSVAFAAKPGLWSSTVTVNLGGGMPSIPPEQMAQMKAMGIQIPNMAAPMTSQYCLSPQEAAGNRPRMGKDMESSCKTENVKTVGRTTSADLVCTGEMNGRGHMETTYASEERYSGRMTFKGTAGGRPMNMTNTFEGRFVSADCGSVR